MSESDYPFEVIRWDGQTSITPEYLCSTSGKPEGSEVQEIDLNTFFSAKGTLRRVVPVLRNDLTGIKVYQVGAIDIPVYIVGRSPEGNWVGLSTRLIQT